MTSMTAAEFIAQLKNELEQCVKDLDYFAARTPNDYLIRRAKESKAKWEEFGKVHIVEPLHDVVAALELRLKFIEKDLFNGSLLNHVSKLTDALQHVQIGPHILASESRGEPDSTAGIRPELPAPETVAVGAEG